MGDVQQNDGTSGNIIITVGGGGGGGVQFCERISGFVI